MCSRNCFIKYSIKILDLSIKTEISTKNKSIENMLTILAQASHKDNVQSLATLDFKTFDFRLTA